MLSDIIMSRKDCAESIMKLKVNYSGAIMGFGYPGIELKAGGLKIKRA